MRNIILFELNEVPPLIFEKFCDWRPQSTFAKLKQQCMRYETHAEDIGILSPWITWPTVHRGVTNENHLIGNFGQDLTDVNKEYPPVWEILAKNNISVGICGSLHSYPMPDSLENFNFYLPDTFAAGSECFPDVLSKFQKFNLKMAGASTRNVSSGIDVSSALQFLKAAPGLGLKPKTAINIGLQLFSERLARWKSIRRRTYQSVLAFDIYMKFLTDKKPAFSTFFTNHVASSMHRYWAASFPDDYQINEFDDEWINRYSNEIDFTMCQADNMFRQLVNFTDKNRDYEIWLLSSMGQEATEAEPTETQLYITNIEKFMATFGLSKSDYKQSPAMLPRYIFSLNDKQTADKLSQSINAISIAGEPVDYERLNDTQVKISLGHRNLYKLSDYITIRGEVIQLEDIGLENSEIQDMSSTTAYHIPQGSFWKYSAANNKAHDQTEKISTIDIAPAILKNFSIAKPSYMQNPTM